MTATATPLPGMPEPLPKTASLRLRADDYQTWIDTVRPVFEKVAATTRRWTSFEIADEYALPDPPKPKAQWGVFIRNLVDEGLIERVGYDDTGRPGGHQSGVKVWRGTVNARRGRAAA